MCQHLYMHDCLHCILLSGASIQSLSVQGTKADQPPSNSDVAKGPQLQQQKQRGASSPFKQPKASKENIADNPQVTYTLTILVKGYGACAPCDQTAIETG